MGAIFNAQANHTPLLVTAGQQARELITLQANLTNRDAIAAPVGQSVTSLPARPTCRWRSPARSTSRTRRRRAPPVSVPMDDWEADVTDADADAA